MRALSGLLALAAILVAGVSFSSATFVAGSTHPGNAFTASNAFNLTVTMVDPGAYLRATVSLQATASDGEDGSSITSVTIQRSPAGAGTWTDVCTDPTSPYSCSFDTTSVGDGLYDFRATVLNDVGGSANSTAVTNRLVDNTNPTATMNDPGANLRLTVSLTATATDTGGSGVASVTIQRSPAGLGIWTDVCTDASSPYSCSFDTTTVLDGLYDFRAISTDNAGNSATSATVTNRRVDNTAPTGVSMTDPGSLIAGTFAFSGSASDAGSGVASLAFQSSPAGAGIWTDLCTDTTSPYSCSSDTSLLTDGLYDFRSLATDAAGNQAASSVWTNRRVDNYFPSSVMTDPGAYLRGTVTLQASASDGGGISSVVIQRSPAGAGIWTDVCTDATSPYSCSFDTTTVLDGLYDFRAVANDNALRATVSIVVANRRVDNTPPTASLTDPGAYLRLTVTLDATATDTAGSGVASVTIQRSPAGAGSWTDVCTDTTSPYSCSFDTTTVADGFYDLRALSTDNAGNTATSATVTNRRVDNTAPTASDIQTTNGGATVGRPEANDTVTFTYSEQILSTSILAGWNGASTAVTVRINNQGANDRLEVWNAANAAELPLTNTFVGLNNNYVTADTTFTATMVQSGASITVTLVALTGGTVQTDATTGTLSWTPSATATDLAGNPCSTTAATESGAADTDF